MIDPKLIVVAFGGNAVYPPTIKGTAQEQLDIMAEACEHLVPMFRAGYRVVITHGNGPVVGNILFRMALTSKHLVPMRWTCASRIPRAASGTCCSSRS